MVFIVRLLKYDGLNPQWEEFILRENVPLDICSFERGDGNRCHTGHAEVLSMCDICLSLAQGNKFYV